MGEPLHQTGLGRTQIDTGHADLGKSKFPGPFANTGQQLMRIDLSAAERHPPIVGTAPRGENRAILRHWPDEAATAAFARRLAASPALRDAYIELHGDLGTGKTSFVRHLLRALGVAGRVKSPTYAVVEHYRAPIPPSAAFDIWHFDFYRFADPREWEDAGFRDLFARPGLKLAEWPDKAAGMLPRADLALHIDLQDHGARAVRCLAGTPTGDALLEAVTP